MPTNKKSLTQHAYLNTLGNLFGYAVTTVVWLFANKYLFIYLGDGMFGVWKYCQRLLSYAEAADGRATQALKWTLANKLESDDFDAKRRDIGCAITVWFRFLPLLLLVGGSITWFSPHFIKELSEAHFTLVRLTCAILMLNTILMPLRDIPDSILIGMNVRYKGLAARVFGVVMAGSLMVYTAFIGWSIVAVAAAWLCANLAQGAVLAVLVWRMFPWVGISKPGKKELRKFFSLSVWTLAWGFVLRFVLLGDVTVLGWATSPETVAAYFWTLTSIRMCMGILELAVNAVAPGLGKLVGQRNFDKSNVVRSEIMTASWFAMTIAGSMVLLWNCSFVKLWVGIEQFVGFNENFLIVLAVTQLAFIDIDGRIIDLTLTMKWKVLLGLLACIVSAILGYFCAVTFSSSIVGLLVGLIVGRTILTVAYPLWLNRFFKWDIKQQLFPVIRGFIITMIFYICSMYLGTKIVIDAWLPLIAFGVISFILTALLMFYLGLSRKQRQSFIVRARNIKFLNRS